MIRWAIFWCLYPLARIPMMAWSVLAHELLWHMSRTYGQRGALAKKRISYGHVQKEGL
jgi:hypothetical protein